MQLDIDLPAIADATGLVPVQLAIDGAGPLPVLEHLSADPTVEGVVLVEFSEANVLLEDADTPALHWLKQASPQNNNWLHPSSHWEEWLGRQLTSHMATFADGATPMLALTNRALQRRATPQYLTTYPDRSRKADYSRVPMPKFMLDRALIHAGIAKTSTLGMEPDEIQNLLENTLRTIAPYEMDGVSEGRVDRYQEAVARIRSHGGRTVFVRLPTSGWIKKFDQARFPPELFGNQLFGDAAPHLLDSYAHIEWRRLQCPDGSHLDRRDVEEFSSSLGKALADLLK